MADYGEVMGGMIAALKADAVLTDPATGKLANYQPDGSPASRANSIFYTKPAAVRPEFPCITVWDIGAAPGLKDQHDEPMGLVRLSVQIDVWGESRQLRAIQAELDSFLETAARGGSMDTANWQFNDIDTSGPWRTIALPEEYASADGNPLEQRSKTFAILAANKTI
ncbi:MAG TPA: hypothetical protein VGN42_21985 [Pirellulales bacterium]|nr:hypothetical protein [Pirellulales bacterium]